MRAAGRFAAGPGDGGPVGVYGAAGGGWAAFLARARAALGVPLEAWRNAPAFGRVAVLGGAGRRRAR